MKLVLEERIEDVDVFDPETLVLYTPPFRFNPGGSCAGIPTGMNDFGNSPSHFDPLVRTFYKEKEVFPIFEAPRIQNSYAEDLLKTYEEAQRGIQNTEPFQFGYDLPEERKQLHFHGPNETTLTHAHLKEYGKKDPLCNLTGYEAAVLDLALGRLGLKRFGK